MATNSNSRQRLIWYARRLRTMEAGEIRWRVAQTVDRIRPEAGDRCVLHDSVGGWSAALEQFRETAGRPLLLDRDRARTIREQHPELVDGLIRAADQVADNSFCFFGYPMAELGEPINWHHDPFSNTQWPDDPSHRIDHRIAAGDVKWIWELNRLQHLPWLAQAWLFTGEPRYALAACRHLDSWIDQNPPGRGIAWRGAFEAGLRAISIAIALQGLRDSPELTVYRYRRIVGVLAESADRCWRGRSLYSSANNHLIGEMAGLAVVSMMCPELRGADRWERHAVETLTSEAGKQILPDGAGAEQSVGYQIASVELLHLVAAMLKARDGAAPPAITDAVDRSSMYLASLVGFRDPDPRYGDCDQEFAVRLGAEPTRTVRDHLGIVAPHGLGVAGPGIATNSLSAEWFGFLAEISTHHSDAGPDTERAGNDRGHFAPAGGLVVLRGGQRRITMDVGALGYLSIAAHGHADALAVTLSHGGVDVIGDPGTGSYYKHAKWRAVMRGTRAHATVCVDGLDQSVIGGPFMWLRHAKVRVHGVDLDAGIVDAEHDGYTRLPGRVIHRRWLVAPPDKDSLLVVDLITGRGAHGVRTCWPLHPSVRVQRILDGHMLVRRGTSFRILHAATAPARLQEAHGDEVGDAGWWSDRLESRVPAWWVGTVCDDELPIVIATLIAPAGPVDVGGLAVGLVDSVIDVRWSEGSRQFYVEVRLDCPAAVIQRASDCAGP